GRRHRPDRPDAGHQPDLRLLRRRRVEHALHHDSDEIPDARTAGGRAARGQRAGGPWGRPGHARAPIPVQPSALWGAYIEGDAMNSMWTRRTFLSGSGALLAATAAPGALAAEKINLRFSDSTTADAPRSQALVQIFAKKIGDEFNFQPYFNSSLYKQGTELVAVQRGNQVPAFDILGAAYVVRDAAHLDRIFKSEIGDTFRKLAREKLDVVILAPAYYGVRHLNLKGKKKINTPQDLAGVKLRMPAGESWQFLGRSIGASPVTVAYSETYVALQTG